MGWLTMKSIKGHSGPRSYLDAQFTQQRPGAISKVLLSALVGRRVYSAAVKQVRIVGGEREACAVICLVRYNPRDSEGYVFGYKDMEESMGPYECNCPEPILDLLTPTDNQYAVRWRARCRDSATARRAKAKKPGPRPGQIIVFDEPLSFADGTSFAQLQVVANPSGRGAVRFSGLQIQQPLSDSQHQEPDLPARRSGGG